MAEVVLSLKLNTVARPDNVDPEHLRYSGNLLINTPTQIFNAIIASGHIPAAFCCGLVIPIPKGQSKDLTNSILMKHYHAKPSVCLQAIQPSAV